MFTSGTNNRKAIKVTLVYLVISCFCALFGAVYELFSHEVYSFYMIYAFAFPMVGGALPFAVLEIYGTTNALSRFYWIAGVGFVIFGVVVGFIQSVLSRKSKG